MDKKTIKSLRATTTAMSKDLRKLKASLQVLNALCGLAGAANGAIHDAAHQELAAAIQSLKHSVDRIAGAIGESDVP